MPKIILASGSPRRSSILNSAGFTNFEVVPHNADETCVAGLPPEDHVAAISRLKAESVAGRFVNGEIVVAADTVVSHGGKIFGKPRDDADAFSMLSLLAGGWHSVYTGLTVICGGVTQSQEEITSVLMRDLTPDEIRRYIATGECLDKAGSYGIQGIGASLIERVDGDFFNVMGLPVYRLSVMLQNVGVPLFTNNR